MGDSPHGRFRRIPLFHGERSEPSRSEFPTLFVKIWILILTIRIGIRIRILTLRIGIRIRLLRIPILPHVSTGVGEPRGILDLQIRPKLSRPMIFPLHSRRLTAEVDVHVAFG